MDEGFNYISYDTPDPVISPGLLTSEDMFRSQEFKLDANDLSTWRGEAFNLDGTRATPGMGATAWLPQNEYVPTTLDNWSLESSDAKQEDSSGAKQDEPWSFTKMASKLWESVTTDKATAAVTMAVISGAAKGVLDMMAADKTSRAATSLKQAEWANTEKVDADKRKRIGSIPTLSRKAAYAPIAQNYSAPGLLNLNRGSV